MAVITRFIFGKPLSLNDGLSSPVSSQPMPSTKRKIHKALWKTQSTGLLLLRKPWTGAAPPSITLERQAIQLTPVTPQEIAEFTGYFTEGDHITFILHTQHYPRIDFNETPPWLTGKFNDWEKALKDSRWKLVLKNPETWSLTLPKSTFPKVQSNDFKFLTDDGQWLHPPSIAPNQISPRKGIINLRFRTDSIGTQVFHFSLPGNLSSGTCDAVFWKESDHEEIIPLPRPPPYINKKSNLPLGAIAEGTSTTFRLFAPRAEYVCVVFWPKEFEDKKQSLSLQPRDDGTWAILHPESLDGWYYVYHVDGHNQDATTEFDPEEPLADPYAKALVTAAGPGIIISTENSIAPASSYHPPAMEDLQIVEVHLRDALARAPIELTPKEREGFTGLTKWLRTGRTYFHDLGVNAIELQPIHEFDCDSPEEYHWGYMPANLFSPSSSYGLDPGSGSQVQEFQDLVHAFHEQGFAVILDVVLNHQGINTPLHGIDKGYYFHMDDSQELLNWSGCGNDFRSDTPMASRLLVDSLVHWVRTYDVDGFRLDLAELIDLECLDVIEQTLRKEKPEILLIAEPWSFRGNISKALRKTCYSSWNDGFREFIFNYVQDQANSTDLDYFLAGSPQHFASFPAQTINYIESHDDRCWIDKITGNFRNNGQTPTAIDIRRTHLAVALLYTALGVPMLSAGQDMLRSKRGVNNTYQRGDLNILEYDRENEFPGTVKYVRDWIRFRQSDLGRLLRLKKHPPQENLQFFHRDGCPALAMHIFDEHLQILFAINPGEKSADLQLPEAIPTLNLLADEEHFLNNPEPSARLGHLPPRSLRLYGTAS
jgi:pullulanase/glycogen debranching enzyme